VLTLLGVVTVLARPGAVVAAIVVQGLPALVRAHRRSLVDLLVGVVPHTTSSPKLGRPMVWPAPPD
jgi:hypothetical protein